MAADWVVERAKEYEVDYVVFPVVFLYRHYLELRLKELWRASGTLLDEPYEPPTTHHLRELWNVVRPRLEKVWPGYRPQDLEAIQEKIDQFEEFDRKSYAFRYPVDTRGRSTLQQRKAINLRQLKDNMDGIATVLDGASTGLSQRLDEKHEMLAYNREEADYYAREEGYSGG
jgi:hypothetical protein